MGLKSAVGRSFEQYAFFYKQRLLFQIDAESRKKALEKCSRILPEQFSEYPDAYDDGYLVYIGAVIITVAEEKK